MSDQGSGVTESPAPASTSGPALPLPPLKLPGLPKLAPSAPGQAQGSSEASGIGTSTIAPTGDKLIDDIVAAINKREQTILADLTYAQALASYKDPVTGQVADPNGAQALSAVIPLVTLIVNGPQPAPGSTGTVPPLPEDHVITDIQKARIVLLRLNDPAFKAAIAPLQQDIQSQINSLLGVGAVVVKALGLAGIAIP